MLEKMLTFNSNKIVLHYVNKLLQAQLCLSTCLFLDDAMKNTGVTRQAFIWSDHVCTFPYDPVMNTEVTFWWLNLMDIF